MTILINVIRVLIILLIIRIVVTWFMGVRHSMRAAAGPSGARPQGRPRPVSERAGGTLVRDPHCGTYIPESRAVVAGSLRFCSTACRDAYALKGNRVSSGNPVS